ncbi:RNA polymerase II subunit A C-terminal domain phosphatase isoform X4 [Hippopotamus amphibius kiboko]|uniref:RNA polymerase II subunit A C-terminal domain phosphatase isoform X4 n=1 Tax=Hippopotamus amphibius kiboko TaxID=575201 RepID=UPI0025972715|nr:RNA polymerase II subunit A C-terminal domain phosphatase isoform X4 [Hippopotamus amphibius kiboko]
MEAPPGGRVPAEGAQPPAVAEVRCPGPGPLRLLEWRVAAGAAVRIGSVLAVCEAAASAQPAGPAPAPARAGSGGCVRTERRLRSERAGVVRELCAQPGQVVAPGAVLVRVEGCSHPVVMKGLCAECGQDLTHFPVCFQTAEDISALSHSAHQLSSPSLLRRLQSENGRPQAPLSTATVSMVHSVPELMVSSEQAEKLGREDQQRLHRSRKLVLMVDLDQTLIHTTEQHCQQMSNKGIFHFQLGRGEPMLHTRLRPHCKEFLEKIAKLYELHVFTFGSRLYAHTIAGFLDPEKKLFSHRILSRDECIDPFSKTGNLRNLFPCGDSMVCIIDDREDVWKFAPNLITVKKYVYFQATGDINAPPGAREPQARRRGADTTEQPPSVKDPEEGRQACRAEQSNGLGKPARELNGGTGLRGGWPWLGQEEERGPRPAARGPSADGQGPPAGAQQRGQAPPEKRPVRGPLGPDPDPDVPSDSGSSSESEGQPSPVPSDGESGEKRTRRRPLAARDAGRVALQGSPLGPAGERPTGASHCGEPGPGVQADAQEEGERDGLCGLGGGCADRKEAETESQNSEQSGITVGESLDQSVEEEEEEEDADNDDHLVHLEEILARVHSDYYARYDRFLRGEAQEAPDIRRIVPELRSRVLADVAIIFSGLHPTNFPIEKTREHYHATALGARILTQLVLDPDDPDRATHLIAARAGTEKVRQAQECGQLHVVNPDWLWSCLERWDKVEEQLFPLRDEQARAQREDGLAAFPDRQGLLPAPLLHPTPLHPKAPPGPEVRIYDASTGKLIRRSAAGPGPPGSLPVHTELSSFRAVQPRPQQLFGGDLPESRDGEQPGPSRRKRQPSMSETMPLYTLCREDLESMDKEVDDILGEGSDESDSEKRKAGDAEEEERRPPPAQPEAPGARRGPTLRGHKRKLNEEDAASESSGASSCEDEEGGSSEADEMAAALEAELGDLM